MGSTLAKISRPLRNWNIESRAQKAISKEKRPAAPTFPSTYKQIELVNKLEPDYKETAQKKNIQLDENLKQVYVRSNNMEIKEIDSRSDPDRPLPKVRTLQEDFEYGFYEPEPGRVRHGKVTLRQVLEFMGKHNQDPEKYSVQNIATEYKLEPKTVENILEYYKLYEVIDFQFNHNQDVIARKIPISQKSGIMIKHTDLNKDRVRKIKLEEPPERKAEQIESKESQEIKAEQIESKEPQEKKSGQIGDK